MREPSYDYDVQLTVGAAAIPATAFGKQITGLCAVCTVAGNATIQLTSGSQMTISLAVGTVILPLATVRVVSNTATATYYALA